MADFFRSLCITICTALFNFIPSLYKLFYDLASNHELFSSETIDTFSKNIYILVSVVMLFAFAVKAIESIINPDMLFDSKKGFTSVIKRSVIALVLIIGIPFAFDLFYEFQDEVMGKSLIEKLIIGVSVGENSNLSEESGAGQMLASSALASVLYPRDGDTCTEYEDNDACIKYNDAIEDIGKLYKLITDINEEVKIDGEKEYVLTYEGYGLLSVFVGGVLIYMLVLFCIDTALRLIKLTFLELTAPVSVVAYVFGGNDILKNWFKEVKGTAFSLFGRIAALALMIFVLSKLPEFIDNNFTGLEGKLVNLLIIMATLMFVKEAPNLIERIFGIKIGGKGGIAGRLGSMAGVGDIAKKGWEKVRNVGGAAAVAGLGLAGAAVGATTSLAGLGFAAGGIGLGLGGKAIANKLKNTKFGEGVRTAGNVLKNASGEKNPIKAIQAGVKTYSDSPVGIVKSQNKDQKRTNKINDSLGIDEFGKVKDSISSASNYKNVVNRSSDLSSSSKNVSNARHDANKRKSIVEGIKTKSEGITSKIAEEQKLIKDDAVKRQLTQLDYDRTHGNITTQEFADRINDLKASGIITEGSATEMLKDLSGMVNLSANAGLSDSVLKDGKLNIGELNGAIAYATSAASVAQSNYESVLNASSDSQKKVMNSYSSASDAIVEQYVKDTSKSGVNYNNETSSTQQSNNQNTSNSSDSSTTSTSTNEAYNDRMFTVGDNSNGGTNPNSTDNSNTGGNNSSSTNNSSSGNNSGGGNSNDQDLSGFFDGLSKDIRDASASTNSILNDQLKTQQSSLDESRKQNNTLENISGGVNNLNNTVDQMNNNIKNFSNTNNKNLKDLSQKLDDTDRNNKE